MSYDVLCWDKHVIGNAWMLECHGWIVVHESNSRHRQSMHIWACVWNNLSALLVTFNTLSLFVRKTSIDSWFWCWIWYFIIRHQLVEQTVAVWILKSLQLYFNIHTFRLYIKPTYLHMRYLLCPWNMHICELACIQSSDYYIASNRSAFGGVVPVF